MTTVFCMREERNSLGRKLCARIVQMVVLGENSVAVAVGTTLNGSSNASMQK